MLLNDFIVILLKNDKNYGVYNEMIARMCQMEIVEYEELNNKVIMN
jgi:hypothetical protein